MMDFSSILNWIATVVADVLAWLLKLVLWVPRKIFSLFVDAILYLLSLIPDPGMSAAVSYVSALASSSGLSYFLELGQINIGLPLVIGAYIARFLIRRLPFIG